MHKILFLFSFLFLYTIPCYTQDFEINTFAKIGLKNSFTDELDEVSHSLHFGLQQQVHYFDLEAHIDVPILNRFHRTYSSSGQTLQVAVNGESLLSGGASIGFHTTHNDARIGLGGGYAIHYETRPVSFTHNKDGLRTYSPVFINLSNRLFGPTFYVNYTRNLFQVEFKYEILTNQFSYAQWSLQTNILINKDLLTNKSEYQYSKKRIEFNIGMSNRLSYYPYIGKMASLHGEFVYHLKNDWGFGYLIQGRGSSAARFLKVNDIFYNENEMRYQIPQKIGVRSHVFHSIFIQKDKQFLQRNKWYYGLGVSYQVTSLTNQLEFWENKDFGLMPFIGMDVGPIKNTLSISIPTRYSKNFYFAFTTALSFKFIRYQKWEEI